jgi:hypothetical protein
MYTWVSVICDNMSQVSPFHIHSSWFIKINFDVIVPSIHTYSWLKHVYKFFVSPNNARGLAHFILFGLLTLVIFGEQTNYKASGLQFSSATCHFLSVLCVSILYALF